MYWNIKVAEKELTDNLITVWYPWGHRKGRLGLIQDIALYLQQNGVNFDIPMNYHLPYPVILPNNSAVDRERIGKLNKVTIYLGKYTS